MAAPTNNLADYQTRLDRASEIRSGDYLDSVEPNATLRGPRGGRYRYDGLSVRGKVTKVAWIAADPIAGVEYEIEPTDSWRASRMRGFRIWVENVFRPESPKIFTLPGNLADLTGAIVRRQPTLTTDNPSEGGNDETD